ncbi:hypothetical protein B0H13DRAFT_1850352 [Mycena leptocephala]|nr:hypothetical protein B0H13DRAFT_1850352 [Mycena leptocephala]
MEPKDLSMLMSEDPHPFLVKTLTAPLPTDKEFGPAGDVFPITVAKFIWDPNRPHRFVNSTNVQKANWKRNPQTVMKEIFVAKSRIFTDSDNDNDEKEAFRVPTYRHQC